MRDELKQLLRAAGVLSRERAQALWDDYRAGAGAAGPAKTRGDEAFATLLAWYGGTIYRHVWGFVRSDAAEDVFQDVLRKLHQHRHHPGLADFTAGVLPWLRAVAIRECVSTHRTASRRARREAKVARPERDSEANADRERQLVVADALEKLKPVHRAVIALHFFEGLTKQDAAAALGINRDTLAARLQEALDRLRHLLPPAVLLVATGPPAVLAAPPPVPSPARHDELVRAALAKAAAGPVLGQGVGTILTGLILTAGVVAGGWVLTHTSPLPEAYGVVAAPPPPVPTEPLELRNRRVLEDETLPRVVRALRPLVMNGGEARVTRLDTYDFRACAEVELRHLSDLHERGVPVEIGVSRLWFFVDCRPGNVLVTSEGSGPEDIQRANTSSPAVLLRVPTRGIDWRVAAEPLEAAVAELQRFPADPRAAAAAVRHTAAVRAALVPYRGYWQLSNQPALRGAFGITLPASPDDPVEVPLGACNYRVTPPLLVIEDGHLRLWTRDQPFTLDGAGRLFLSGTGSWWQRVEG